jgi:tRNA (cmo5U34)-methyltransferase
MVTADVWKLPNIVDRFLSYRTAIPLAQEQLGIMVSILKTRSKPVETFLDLGCGDGVLGAAILGEYPAAHGVFVDFSEPMLDQARAQLKNYSKQLVFENLDYGDSTWVQKVQAEGPFDAIVSGYSIHHQSDLRKHSIYQEIFSLLRSGGWFVNIEHIAPASKITTDLFESHYASVRFAIEQQKGGRRSFAEVLEEYQTRPDKAANLLAPAELQCNWLREIGFEEVDCYFRIYELAVIAGRKPEQES